MFSGPRPIGAEFREDYEPPNVGANSCPDVFLSLGTRGEAQRHGPGRGDFARRQLGIPSAVEGLTRNNVHTDQPLAYAHDSKTQSLDGGRRGTAGNVVS